MAIAPTYQPVQERAFDDEADYDDEYAGLPLNIYGEYGPIYGYDEEGYAVSDALPMAEHSVHQHNMFNTVECLDVHFPGDVYVAGNNFLHYQREDNLSKEARSKRLSPDCYVVFDVTKSIRRKNYKSWEHGDKTPAIVFEFTSKETRKNDTGHKKDTYEQIFKTPEYILFDPFGEYLNPRLWGYRLNEAGVYERIPIVDGRMYSEQLDLWLVPQGDYLRLFDEKTGEFLRTLKEAEAERLLEKQRAEQQQQRAENAELAMQDKANEVARLQAELEALRKQMSQ